MATVSFKALGLLLLGGALSAFADDAGKAAAKAYSRPANPSVSKTGVRAAPAAPSLAPIPAAIPGPGRMQVEEPASGSAGPDAQASKAWQKSHAKGLTEEQKAAFRERKEKMEGMIALIKAKRKALRDAKPEDRAALARELHSLILEKDVGTSSVAATARVEDKEAGKEAKEAVVEAEAAVREKAAEAQIQRREEIRTRQMERRKQRNSRDED